MKICNSEKEMLNMNKAQRKIDVSATDAPTDEDPPSYTAISEDKALQTIAPRSHDSKNGNGDSSSGGFMGKIKDIFGGKNGDNSDTLREAIEEYIEGSNTENVDVSESVAEHEKSLLANILQLRDVSVYDVMIPRADIIAIDIETSQKDLLLMLSEKQHSRLPVYRESLDDVIGTIHIKDILATLAQGKPIVISELTRDVPIISPSMHVLDLLLMMRTMRKHMCLVVDEFGGIDGLIAVGDVIESIIGEIDDEYDNDDDPEIQTQSDGSLIADGRFDIDEFEKLYGTFLTDEEREDVETLGGLVFTIAGRIPARGEVLEHKSSGMAIEIIDGDPRRVNKILIRALPNQAEGDDQASQET